MRLPSGANRTRDLLDEVTHKIRAISVTSEAIRFHGIIFISLKRFYSCFKCKYFMRSAPGPGLRNVNKPIFTNVRVCTGTF